MKTTTKARFSTHHLAPLRRVAETRKTSVSVVIESAITPYIEGQKQFPKMPHPGTVHTGFTINHEKMLKLKQIAGLNNLSWDEAVRYAVENFLAELGVYKE